MMSKKSPQLRFDGFTDDWVQRKLGDLVDSYNKIVSGKSNYPVATSSRRGLFLQSDYFDGSRSGIDENVDFHKVPEKYITYRHMSDDSIFKFNQNDFDTPVLVSKEYPVFRSNQQANQTFLLDHLNNSPEFLKFSTLQKLGGTRVRLYFKNLQAYKLMMPNIEEQNAIASFFTTVDNLIAANQRKLDLLKEQKKGYLQKMFPKNGEKVPELRFAGLADDWEERKLSEGTSKIGDGLHGTPNYSDNGDVFFINGNNLVNGKIVITKETKLVTESNQSKDDKLLNMDTILMSINGTIGNLAWYNNERVMLGKSAAYLTVSNFDKKFIFSYLQTSTIKNYFLNNLTGTTIKNLGLKTIRDTTLFVPTLEEQQKIGSLFKQLDDTIALHQRKLDLLKERKKGFLQKMFV